MRNGKIAHLPKPIRAEINQRLERGATARSLVPWLNALPEVKVLIEAEFDGHPISEHNLSQWKKGGFQEWLRYQEAVALAEHLAERGQEMKALEKDRLPMSEVFTLWMTSRMAVSTREIERLKGEAAWRKQRQFCADLMKIRRAEQQAEKLQIERERTELQRQKLQFQREQAERKRSAQDRRSSQHITPANSKAKPEPFHPESLQCLSPLLTEEQKEARWKEILHIPKVPTPSPRTIRPPTPDLQTCERAA